MCLIGLFAFLGHRQESPPEVHHPTPTELALEKSRADLARVEELLARERRELGGSFRDALRKFASEDSKDISPLTKSPEGVS